MKKQVNKSFPKINQVKLKTIEDAKIFKDHSKAKISTLSKSLKTNGKVQNEYNAYT